MKANEIIFRQTRIVYVLMVLVAILGLAWGFREHQRQAAGPVAPGAQPAPPAAAAPR